MAFEGTFKSSRSLKIKGSTRDERLNFRKKWPENGRDGEDITEK